MKKILMLAMTVIVLIIMLTFNVSAQENVSVYIDDAKVEFDVQPQIINGRTMVPMRKIFEELGAVVEWDEATQTVIGTKFDMVVKITINDGTIYRNGVANVLDVPAQLIDSRTLVPIRAVSESFGCDVIWDDYNKTVYISTNNEINDSEFYCYFDDIDYMQCLENKKIKIIPALEITYEQYTDAISRDNTVYLDGKQFKIDTSYLEESWGYPILVDEFNSYGFPEPDKELNPVSVISCYLNREPIEVGISDDLMIRYGVLGYNNLNEPYGYQTYGRKVVYTAAEYFPHFIEYSFYHYYRATIRNGELVMLDVLYCP